MKQLEQNQIMLDHQKELLKNELTAIEKERKRIAQDLHDEVGANLSYIGLNLAQINNGCSANEDLHKKLLFCHTQLNKSITDVRRISHDLLPPALDMFGIVPAIQQHIETLKSSFSINFHADEEFNELKKDKSLQLYRVLLEIIGNAIKHSKGDTISIKMEVKEDLKIVTISDNGIGYDFEQMKHKSGLGLKNIISRVDAIGGSYRLGNSKIGSEIIITIK